MRVGECGGRIKIKEKLRANGDNHKRGEKGRERERDIIRKVERGVGRAIN